MIGLADRAARRLGDRLESLPVLPRVGVDDISGLPSEPLRQVKIDDATAAYVAKMRDPFELLRQAEAQLAGLLVLATAGGHAIAGHPMLELAAEAVKQAEDGIQTIKAPPPALHHYHHVVQALRAIAQATAQARRVLRPRDDAAIDAVLGPLRAAHQNLLWATTALPGFEVVALSQACCANHTATAKRSSP